MEYFEDDEYDNFDKNKFQDEEIDFEEHQRDIALKKCQKLLSTIDSAINNGHPLMFEKCCNMLMDEAYYEPSIYKHVTHELSNLFYFVCNKQEYDMMAILLHYPVDKRHVADVVLNCMLLDKPDFEPFYIMMEHHLAVYEKDENLALMYQEILVEIARSNHVILLRDLLESRLLSHEKLSELFFFPLLRACQCESFGVIDTLLTSGYARADANHSQALQVAYNAGAIDICKYLLTSQYIAVNAKISDNDY